MSDTLEAMTGVKVVSAVFALIGAGLGITYSPPLTKKLALGALLAGLVCGALGPEFAAWALAKSLGIATPLPLLANNALAVIFGIGGMFIVPGLVKFWQAFGADPFGWLDRMRGKKNDGGKP